MRSAPLVLVFVAACFLPELDQAPSPNTAETCRTCAADACAMEYDICTANSACDTIVECVLACSEDDSACTTGCFTANPDGQDDATALLSCTDGTCDTCPSM